MNKNIFRMIFRHMFAAFASAAFAVTILITIVRIALDTNLIKNLPYKSGLFDNTYTELVSDLKKLSPASGVAEEFFDTAIDKQVMSKRMEEFYLGAMDGQSQSDIKAEHEALFRDELYTKLCNYAEDEGYTLTDSIKDELMHLSEICAQRCSARTANTILGRALESLGAIFDRFSIYSIILIIIMAAFTIFCWYFAVWLGSRSGIILCSGGLMLILIPTYIYVTKLLSRIGISSYSMHTFFATFANSILMPMLFIGVAFIVISIIMFVIKQWLEN